MVEVLHAMLYYCGMITYGHIFSDTLQKQAGWVDRARGLSDKIKSYMSAASNAQTRRPGEMLARSSLDELAIRDWYRKQYERKGFGKLEAFRKATSAAKRELLGEQFRMAIRPNDYVDEIALVTNPVSLPDSIPTVLIRNKGIYDAGLARDGFRLAGNNGKLVVRGNNYEKALDHATQQFRDNGVEDPRAFAEGFLKPFINMGAGGVTIPAAKSAPFNRPTYYNLTNRLDGPTVHHEARELRSLSKSPGGGVVTVQPINGYDDGFIFTGLHNHASVLHGDEAMYKNLPEWFSPANRFMEKLYRTHDAVKKPPRFTINKVPVHVGSPISMPPEKIPEFITEMQSAGTYIPRSDLTENLLQVL
jgi:hypothetical protein